MLRVKRNLFLLLLLMSSRMAYAQFSYGTTGLLHMPTADMQADKTFLAGASFLNEGSTPRHWNYNTYNYYINFTFFPWLEVAYTCTLHKAMRGNTYFPEFVWGKYCNQDRQFSARIRLIKENQYWKYMPAVVIGGNDVLTRDWQGTAEREENSGIGSPTSMGNGHWNRYYISLTKHCVFRQLGEFGFHLAYVYNRRKDYHMNGPCIGIDFRPSFHLPLQIMAEYDSRTVNLGLGYSIWKDHINVIGELNNFRYLSVGIFFKVHLK